MLVHRHPVFQKVIIGVFVWGMLIFGIHVANGQMQFPTGTMTSPPSGMTNFQMPVDMPKPPVMPTGLPSFSQPTGADCNTQCDQAVTNCKTQAGDNKDAVAKCATIKDGCSSMCAQAPGTGSTPPMPPIMPSTGDCSKQCDGALEVCKQNAGSNESTLKTCSATKDQCYTKCSQIPSMPSGFPTNMPNFGGTSSGEPSNSTNDVNKLNGIPGMPSGMPNPEDFMKKGGEMQKAGMEQALKSLKNGVKGVVRVIKTIAARIDATKAKGTPVPKVLSDAIADAQKALDEVQAATDLEIGQAAMERIQDDMDIVTEELPKLEMAANLPKILKQVEKEYTRLSTSVRRMRVRLTKVEIPKFADKIAELDKTMLEIRSAIDAAKASGVDPETAIEKLQEQAFDKFEDAWQLYGSIEALRALKSTLAKITLQLKADERLVVKLEKQGSEQAAALRTVFVKLKDKAGNLSTSAATWRDGAGNTASAADLDMIFEKVQDVADAQQEFEDLLSQSQDDGDMTNDKLGTANNWGVPQFAPPSGLPGSSVTDEKSLKMMQNMSGFMPKPSN